MTLVDAGDPPDYQHYRRIIVSPTVNTPDPFPGFAGFCGWPKICKLCNGDLYVTFSAGYWHYSPPLPIERYEPPEYVQYLRSKHPYFAANQEHDGGRMMWTRSRDQGQTWTKPKTFPVVPGAYAVSDIIQLSNGTMLAIAEIELWHGLRFDPPRTPLEFAKMVVDRLPQENVLFRSEDNGETWIEHSRFHGPLMFATTSHDFLETDDGRLLLLTAGVPFPEGKHWGVGGGRFVGLLRESLDGGYRWRTISVIGSNDFDVEEGALAQLPDGSLAFGSRITSAFYKSFDGGMTWTEPRRLHESSIFKKGDFVVAPDGTAVMLTCGGEGGHGQVFYSRDSGESWIKPHPNRGFIFNPIAYYPDACVLDDGSIFSVGDHQGFASYLGEYSAEVTAVRFRIRSQEEGDGIELLPIGGASQPVSPDAPTDAAEIADRVLEKK